MKQTAIMPGRAWAMQPSRSFNESHLEGAASPRYHALDSLRASMMLLGIYLHVVVGYSGDGHWPYIDSHPTSALNWTLGVIHSFRMPAFYMMAGFFGALLWNRRGIASFVANRSKRVLLPFLLFWTLLFPVIAGAVVGLQHGTDQVLPAFTSGTIFKHLHPLHLWFLEYLVLLYIIGGVAAYLCRWLPESIRRGVLTAYRWGLQRSYAPLLFALFSWIPLRTMHGNLKDCDGFVPELRILIAYVVPFGFGWLLYHQRELLPRFERHVWLYLAGTVPAFFWYGLVPGGTHPWLKAAGNVTLCWLWSFACIGLFLKFRSRPSPLWRYLSDASYWMFIMHMPVVVGLQVGLVALPIPALAKVPIVLALSVLILLVSYDLLVRPTWLGALLNGRRYPRNLPEMETPAMVKATAEKIEGHPCVRRAAGLRW